MSALIWVVMTLLCAVSLAKDCGSSFQVRSCSGDQKTADELEYVITSNELAIQNWKLCPRSDSLIPQWRVSFELNSTIVFGVFCNDMAFNSSIICVTNGTLVIKRERFEKQNGTYHFNFISSELESSLQIMFAPFGVYPLYPTVHVDEGDDYAKLTWLIFDSNVPITIRSFRGSTLLTDGISSEVDGITVVEGHECISTESGESTKVWNVFINNPNSSAEGDYILVVNNSIGQSSATVELIVDSISPSSTIKMISSTSIVDSPTDAPFSIAPLTIGILMTVVSVVIMLIDGVLIIILIAYLKKHKSCNKDKPENIEMSENSSIEIEPDAGFTEEGSNEAYTSTPNRTRPSTVGLSTSAIDTPVITNADSTINTTGITNRHRKNHNHNNKGGEYTNSSNVISTPQCGTHRAPITRNNSLSGNNAISLIRRLRTQYLRINKIFKELYDKWNKTDRRTQLAAESRQDMKYKQFIPPDNSLSNDFEGNEYTDSKDVTTTPNQTLIPPDDPLSSNSGSSIAEQLLQEQKIVNMFLKSICDKEAVEMAVENQSVTLQQQTQHLAEQKNTLESLLQSAPNISQLNDLVGSEIPSKWELFGVQLGLEQSYLNCLRYKFADPKDRFNHLFNQWKTMKTSDFTWATVIKVLRSNFISEYSLAESVLRHLENSSEGGEYTDLPIAISISQLETRQTHTSPDSPLSGNPVVSLILQEERRTNRLLENMYISTISSEPPITTTETPFKSDDSLLGNQISSDFMAVNALKLPTCQPVLPDSPCIRPPSQLEMVALQQDNQGLIEALNINEKENTLDESDKRLFVQECRKGQIKIHPLKCILSGLPRVGKTSFISRLQGKKPLFECPSTGLQLPVSISILERTKFTSAIIENGGNWIHTSNVLEGYLSLQLVKTSSLLLQQVKTSSYGEATAHISDNHSYRVIPSDSFSTSIENAPSIEPSGHFDTPNSMGIEKHPVHDFLSDVLKNPSLVYEILMNLQKSKTVYFMDTGGQPEFHELLPPILHGPALHLIFFNASLNLNEPVKVNFCHTKTEIESVQYTANSSSIEVIHQLLSTLYSLHLQEKSRQSKAVVLGSHIDLLGEDESQRRYKIEEISHLLKQYIENTDYYENAFLTFSNDSDSIFLPIDNKTASDEELEDIKKFLEDVFNDFEPVPLPITWAAFHLILRYKYEKSGGVCTIEECTDVAVECGIKRDDVVSVLRYLHNNVGTILYYEEVDDLNKLVICDPNVLFQGISHLVAVSFAGCGKFHNIAKKIRKSGKVPLHVLNKAKSPDPNSPLKVSQLIKLLTHYKLMKQVEQDTYFMPCLLQPEETLESSVSGDEVSRLDCPPLLIIFKGGYIPVGVFSAIVIELSSEWDFDDSKPLYRNHVDFIAHSHRVELRSCYTFLEIRITAHDEASSYCYHTRQFFKQCLSNVLRVHHHTAYTEVFEGFYCPGSLSCQSRHMWKYKKGYLMCSAQERCRGYENPYPFRKLSPVQRSWFEENPITEQTSPMKVHAHESSLSQPKYECDFLTGSDIPDVLQAIESEPHWFMLGLALHVRHNKLEEINGNYKNIQECRYKMVCEWISSRKATWNELVNALCCSIVNNKQLAEEIEKKYMKVKKSV